MRWLRRGLRLTAGQWWLLLNAWSRLLVVDIQLRALGVQRTARMVPAPVIGQANRRQLQRAEAYAYWLRLAARHHVVRAMCLHQSTPKPTWRHLSPWARAEVVRGCKRRRYRRAVPGVWHVHQ